MSITAPQIECYLYAGLEGLTQIKLTDSGGGPFTFTLSSTKTVSDALTDWETQANAHGTLAGTYTFDYLPAVGKVSFLCSENFTLDLEGSLPEALGFLSDSYTGDTSHTSDTTPLAVHNPINIDYTNPQVMREQELHRYRWNRITSQQFYRARVSRLTVTVDADDWEDLGRGPLLASRARYYPLGYTSGAWASDNLRGYLDVDPFDPSATDTFGDLETDVEVTVAGVVGAATGTNTSLSGWAAIAEGLRYGWQICWLQRFEGIPYLFSEYALTGSVPSGYTLEPSLVMDQAERFGSQIDARTGIGRSYDLAVKLLRSTVTRDLFTPPSVTTRLVGELDYNETTEMEVEDASGFAAGGGSVYIGREYIGYGSTDTVSTPNTLDTLVRGNPSGDWRGYQYDLRSSVGTWITDRPVLWRGRIAELHAVPVDPYGGLHGANVLSDAAMVWRGNIETKPEVSFDGWTLSCRSQERRLNEPIGVEITGTGEWILDADPTVEVDPNFTVNFRMDYGTQVDFTLTPFSGYSPGDHIPLSQARDDFQTEWFTVVSTLTALQKSYIFPSLIFRKVSAHQESPDGTSVLSWWQAVYWGSCASGYNHVDIDVFFMSGFYHGFQLLSTGSVLHSPAGVKPNADWISTPLLCTAKEDISALCVTIDEGDPGDVPSSGYVIVEAGDEELIYRYDDVTQVAGNSSTLRLEIHDGQKDISSFVALQGDGEVTSFPIRFATQLGAPNTPQDLMRIALESSGRGDNGTYDTQPARSGMDMDAVDEDSFDDELDGGWVSLGNQQILLDEEASWQKTWGGLLALSERCCVSTAEADGSAVNMRIVRTSLCDIGTADVEITDEHLLTTGDGAPPVREVPGKDAPNVVKVKLTDDRGEKIGNILQVDDVLKRAIGEKRWSLEARGFDREKVADAVRPWAEMRTVDNQLMRTFEIDVVPWLAKANGEPIDLGDIVRLNSTHFRLSDPTTAGPGYDGPARVLGRQIGVTDYSMRLLLGVAGIVTPYALAPSTEVLSYTGPAGAPTSINIAAEYYDLMVAYKEGVSDFDLVVYERSLDDAATDYYTIDGVALPLQCQLTVSATGGAPDLSSGTWFVTLPVRASSNASQQRHLHTNTPGAAWR